MDERPPRERREGTGAIGADAPTEGVRIIDADEAAEHGGAVSRRAEGMPRYGDRPEGPPEGPRPALRFPRGAADAGDVVRPRVSAAAPSRTDDADHGWAATAGGWEQPGEGAVAVDTGPAPHALDGTDVPGDDEPSLVDVPDEPVVLDDDGAEAGPRTQPGGVVPPAGRRRRPRRARPAGAGGSSGATGRSGARSGDRDLKVAVGVGVVLAAAALLLLSVGPAYGVGLVAVIVTLCAAEMFGALQRAGHQPATLLGLVATIALVLSAYWRGEPALPLVLTLTVVFTLLWYLVGVSKLSPTLNGGVTVLTVAYIGLFGSFAALMLRLPNGTGILLGTALAVVANDVGALFAGRRFGRSPLARHISPHKTLEGAVGGALASIVVSYVVLDLLGVHPWDDKGGSALALGALVAVLAPIGDLTESMLKRDLGIKDMGSILPGHGGLVDRFDALLFVLPAAYYLCRLLEIA